MVMSRQNRDISISIEISRSSRLTFWNCRDFLDRRDWYFFGVEIEISIEITSRQIETPRVSLHLWLNLLFVLNCQTGIGHLKTDLLIRVSKWIWLWRRCRRSTFRFEGRRAVRPRRFERHSEDFDRAMKSEDFDTTAI
jgi:hypothetical protein